MSTLELRLRLDKISKDGHRKKLIPTDWIVLNAIDKLIADLNREGID